MLRVELVGHYPIPILINRQYSRLPNFLCVEVDLSNYNIRLVCSRVSGGLCLTKPWRWVSIASPESYLTFLLRHAVSVHQFPSFEDTILGPLTAYISV